MVGEESGAGLKHAGHSTGLVHVMAPSRALAPALAGGVLMLPGVAHASDVRHAVTGTTHAAWSLLREFSLSFLSEELTPDACAGFELWDVAFLGILAAVFISVLRLRHSAARERLDVARHMVEQGLEPPSELLGVDPRADLRRGLVLCGAGIGLLVASIVGGKEGLSPAGLIPGFIGVGYLVSHWLARRSVGDPSRGGVHANRPWEDRR